MATLVIRKTGINNPKQSHSLEIRDHGLGGTDYTTITYMSQEMAHAVEATKDAYFLYQNDREDGLDTKFRELQRIQAVLDLNTEKVELEKQNELARVNFALIEDRNARIENIKLELARWEAK